MSLLRINRSIFLTNHRHFASKSKTIRIGCASGFWGDTPTAVPQLLNGGKLNYLMFDYLSEVTMSLMTAAKSKNPDMGYAPDFVLFAMGPHLKQIKNQGVKVLRKNFSILIALKFYVKLVFFINSSGYCQCWRNQYFGMR